ncbi:MAG: prepilin-type N-terminal cleavage/methylation domain-containing protein [Planctomycetota bacterium]
MLKSTDPLFDRERPNGSGANSAETVSTNWSGANKQFILTITMKQCDKSIRGVTLLEMMIALVCLSAIVLATFEIMTQSYNTNATVNAWNMLTQWGQKAINQMNLDITQACVIYQNDTLGNGYVDDLQSDANFPALFGSVLPLINQNGTFGPDTTVSYTGNALLYATNTTPFVSDALTNTRRVDMYRLVAYYLSPITQTIGAKPTSLRLVKWVSKEFADYNHVMSITTTERADFVYDLYFDRDIRHLWIPRNTSNTAFYAIDEYGNVNATPEPSFTIPTGVDTDGSAMVKNVINDLGRGFATVAWNNSAAFSTPDLVPKFAQGNEGGSGFPHGLEVQIIGPTGARQVFIRLVLAYAIGGADQSLYSTEAHTIITFREY